MPRAARPSKWQPTSCRGGSVSFELGGLSKDTVELRDGTVVLGDVLAMSMTSVSLRVEGKDVKYDRNQVRKIILVERITTSQPALTHPIPAQTHP